MCTLLGLRRTPGTLALLVFRLMPRLYRVGLGPLFGRRFLLLTHRGRTSGRLYHTALKVMADDRGTGEVVVCSVYGGKADWLRNIVAAPAEQIAIGRRRFRPRQRFLTEDEGVAATQSFRHAHPGQFRLFSLVLGWGPLESQEALRAFVQARAFVAFQPAAGGM